MLSDSEPSVSVPQLLKAMENTPEITLKSYKIPMLEAHCVGCSSVQRPRPHAIADGQKLSLDDYDRDRSPQLSHRVNLTRIVGSLPVDGQRGACGTSGFCAPSAKRLRGSEQLLSDHLLVTRLRAEHELSAMSLLEISVSRPKRAPRQADARPKSIGSAKRESHLAPPSMGLS